MTRALLCSELVSWGGFCLFLFTVNYSSTRIVILIGSKGLSRSSRGPSTI